MSVLYSVGEKSTENNMEAVQKGCAGPPLHLQKDSRLCKQKLQKTIRVSIDVKQHLDEMKGSVSASEFIETMLSYFERNGVDPEHQSTGSSRHWNFRESNGSSKSSVP